MKTRDFAEHHRESLIRSIVNSKRKRYFKTWARAMRKALGPTCEMSSEDLWKRFLSDTLPTWASMRDAYRDMNLNQLNKLAAECQAHEQPTVVDINVYQAKSIELDR